jgi:hypothetical protein
VRRLVLTALVVLLAACGGGGKTEDAGPKRFLLTMHSTPPCEISTKPDAELVALGRQACAGLDAKESSDAIVTGMSSDALPGSAAYNEYAYLVASAATQLCTGHKAEMQLPELPGD